MSRPAFSGDSSLSPLEFADPMGFVLEDVQLSEKVKSAVPIPTAFDPEAERRGELSPGSARIYSILQDLWVKNDFKGVQEEAWQQAY
jgi:hypothetical protein